MPTLLSVCIHYYYLEVSKWYRASRAYSLWIFDSIRVLFSTVNESMNDIFNYFAQSTYAYIIQSCSLMTTN